MKILSNILYILNVIGYALPISFFLLTAFYFSSSFGFPHGLCLTMLLWSLYILCVPSHHGGSTLEFLIQTVFGRSWCLTPLLWNAALALNAITVWFAPRVYLDTMPTHLLFHIVTRPSPGWYIIFASSLGTFYPWIIGHETWLNPRYGHRLIYYFLKLFGLYVFFKCAYPQWVIIMNLVGSR